MISTVRLQAAPRRSLRSVARFCRARRPRLRCRNTLASIALYLLLALQPALAYRPFDGTDADVVGAGELELELGLGHLRQGSNRWWVAPRVVANFGLEHRRELVLQGQGEFLQQGSPDTPAASFVEAGAFMKEVIRPGVLQDEPGPSIATEYGFLLPGLGADRGLGFSGAGIVSQRWSAATVNLNAALAVTREHRADAFLAAIIEGPYRWPLRPVMELTAEQASGGPRTVSRLVGLIWRSQERLSFDVGVRSANAGTQHINEIRIGLTWDLALGR